jgi:hypothetical protein
MTIVLPRYATSNVIPSKAGIQDPRAQPSAPCSGQGQALDPRFRRGDETECGGAV